MNERIKELSKQAGGEFYEGFAGSTNFVKFAEDDFEKFAELIVKECMSLVSEPGPDMNDTERGILAQIKHHFGVEE